MPEILDWSLLGRFCFHRGILYAFQKCFLGTKSAIRVEPADHPHEIEKIICHLCLLFFHCRLLYPLSVLSTKPFAGYAFKRRHVGFCHPVSTHASVCFEDYCQVCGMGLQHISL